MSKRKRRRYSWKDYREMLMKMSSKRRKRILIDKRRFEEGVQTLREMFGETLNKDDAEIALGVASFFAMTSLKPDRNVSKEKVKSYIKTLTIRLLARAFNKSEEEIEKMLPKERKYKLVVEVWGNMINFIFIKKEGLEGKLNNVDAELPQLI